MVRRLLKYGLSCGRPATGDLPPTPDPRAHCPARDGGGHGLARAHDLARYLGTVRVAATGKGRLTPGHTARHTVRIRWTAADAIVQTRLEPLGAVVIRRDGDAAVLCDNAATAKTGGTKP